MPCPECHRPLSNNALCCAECKEKLKQQLDYLRTYCSSNNAGYVLLAYGIIKGNPLFKRAVKLHGHAICGQGNFKTVAQLYRFVIDALDDYCANHNNWDGFLSFYQQNGCNLIDFVEYHL